MSDSWRFRSDYNEFAPYKTVLTLEQLSARYGIPVGSWIKLNQNESNYGCAPSASASLGAIELHRYPDTDTVRLRRAIANYLEVDADQVVAGNGGDELIDTIFRLFIDPDDEVVNCPPTFGFYPVAAKLNRAVLVAAPRESDWHVSVEAVERAITDRTKLILLCSPNNPTGNPTAIETVEAVARLGFPVLVDEAYGEFSRFTVIPLMSRYPNVMVIRTFSKWAGLAGLRIGYGIFSESLALHIRAIRQAYTVNAAAEEVALASLADRSLLAGRISQICTDRDRLVKQLDGSGLVRPWPSEANFVYCTPRGPLSAAAIQEELLKRGIIIRLFASPDALRVTIGTTAEMARFVSVLEDVEANVSRETSVTP